MNAANVSDNAWSGTIPYAAALVLGVLLAVAGWYVSQRSGLSTVKDNLVTTLQTQVNVQRDQIADLQSEIGKRDARIAYLEQQRQDDKERIDRLEKQVERLERLLKRRGTGTEPA